MTAPPTAVEADRLRLDLRTAEASLKSLAPVLECALDLIEREQDRGSCFLCDTKLASCKCSDMYAFRKAVWPHHPFRPSEDGSRCTYIKPEGDAFCDSPEAWHPVQRTTSPLPSEKT